MTIPKDNIMSDTTKDAVTLTDEQLGDILREHWGYQGVTSERHIRNAMRAAILADRAQVQAEAVRVKLARTADQWRKCDPDAMSRMSQAAIFYALQDAKHDVLAMHNVLTASNSDDEPKCAPGWKVIAVRAREFDALMEAMDRAERKDYLPDAMAAEWEAFEFIDATRTPAPSTGDQS